MNKKSLELDRILKKQIIKLDQSNHCNLSKTIQFL